jgi:uncharacterized phiE125 gp8 family phage protein
MAATDLITLDEAKAFIKPTPVGEDALLSALIEAATESIEAWLQGTLVVQRTIAEQYEAPHRWNRSYWPSGWPSAGGAGASPYFFLRSRPIVSVTSIADPSGHSIPSTDYSIEKQKGVLLLTQSWQLPRGADAQRSYYLVTYVAGLVADTASVPERFKQAARLLVSRQFRTRQPGIESGRVGDLAVTYREPGSSSSAGSLPNEVAVLIAGDRTLWV